MRHKIVREIQQAKRRAVELRKKRDDAAASLRAAGYSSREMAERVTVQASRVRQYVTAGRISGEYGSLQSFVDAYNAWEMADARLSRLREERNRLVHEELKAGRLQNEVAAEFGVSQFLISHILRNKGEVTLL